MKKDEVNDVVNASLSEYKEFVESAIWLDMKTALKYRLESFRDEIDQPDCKNTAFLRGAIRELKYLLAFPETVIEELEAERMTPKGASDE